jgi:hypothetical protein
MIILLLDYDGYITGVTSTSMRGIGFKVKNINMIGVLSGITVRRLGLSIKVRLCSYKQKTTFNITRISACLQQHGSRVQNKYSDLSYSLDGLFIAEYG